MSSRRHWLWFGLLLLAVLPYTLGLGWTSIVDSNEAFYAETPREMIESGDFVNPSFNYQPRFNKPPLSYWTVAGLYTAFGTSDGVARLAIALGGLVVIGIAYGLGRLVFSPEAGCLAAVALATMPRFLMFSRRIIIDVYVTMFMGLALLCFVLAERHSSRRRLYLVLMYASIGLGVLTKGPIALLLPAGVLGVYLLMHGAIGRWRQLMLPTGLGIVALIVLPWYAVIYAQHGWTHIAPFLLVDNVQRFAAGVGDARHGPFFYLTVLLGDQFPWSVLLPLAIVAVVASWAGARRAGRKDGSTDAVAAGTSILRVPLAPAGGILLALWIGVIVGFFSLSATKQDLYILPVVPAAAALIGGLLGPIARREATPYLEWARMLVMLAAGLLTLAGVGVVYVVTWGPYPLSLAGGRVIGAIAAVGGAAVAWLAFRRSVLPAIVGMALAVTSLHWIFVLVTLPDFERYKPIPAFVEQIERRAGSGARIGYYRFASPSMVFYLRRPVFEAFDERQLVQVFGAAGEVYCVMTAADYEAVRASLPGPTQVLDSRPVLDVRWRNLFSSDPLPQVVLVTNQ